MADLTLLAVVEPPSDVTEPVRVLLGWAMWIIATLCIGRLMFLGGRWGWCRLNSESFDHTPREMLLVLAAGIICASAGTWVTFIDSGTSAQMVTINR